MATVKVVPEGLTEEHLTYLDELRESGETNMFGASPYLEGEFGLNRRDAKAYLIHWMETFGERHPNGR